MKRTLITQLSAACAALVAWNTFAADSALDHLPRGTRWVMHTDIKAMQASTFGKYMEEKMDAKGCAEKMEQLAEALDVDLRKDLLSVTFYGPDQEREHSIMLMRANVDGEKLLTYVEEKEGFQKELDGYVTVLSWIQDKG